MVTIKVTGAQGWTQYAQSGGTADIIDATSASWNANNEGASQLEYPFYIKNWQKVVQCRGGAINGTYSLTKDWGSMYSQGNGAAVFLKDCANGSSVTDWTMERVWDGVRMVGVDDYLIENVRINGTRDDATEADEGRSGVIRRCLFENCFAGISFGDANTPTSALSNVLQIDRTLVSMAVYQYRGAVTHVTPLKADQNSPKLLITNSVFAISRADHETLPRLQLAFDRVLPASSGNYWLNLSDQPLPDNYPKIPAAFTYLQGQSARDHWAKARKAYLAGDSLPPVVPSINSPTTSPEILHVIEIDPASGVIRIQTPEAYVAAINVGAANSVGSDTKAVTLTVEAAR